MSNGPGKRGLILIGLAVVVIILFFGIFCYSIILYDEVYIVAVAHPKDESFRITCQITSDDFNHHPALKELFIKKKFVLISYGPFWDILLRIDPRSRYHTVNQEGESLYSMSRISWDESRILLKNYSRCEFNETVYHIVQSA